MHSSFVFCLLTLASAIKQAPEIQRHGQSSDNKDVALEHHQASRIEALHSREASLEDKIAQRALKKEARDASKAQEEAWKIKHEHEKEYTIAKRERAFEQAKEGFAANRQVAEFAEQVRSAAKMAVASSENHIIVPGEDKWMQAFSTASGISTKAHLAEVVAAFEAFTANGTSMKPLLEEHEKSVAEFTIGARRQLENFKAWSASVTGDDREILAKLGETLGQWRTLFMKHQAEAAKLRSTIVDQMPHALINRFGPMVALMTPSVSTRLSVRDFVNVTRDQGCSKVLNLMKELQPEVAKIGESQQILTASAAMIPQMRTLSPKPSETTITFIKYLIRLGFVEALGAQGAAENLVTTVGPVLVSKLQCMSAAGHACGLTFFSMGLSMILIITRLF